MTRKIRKRRGRKRLPTTPPDFVRSETTFENGRNVRRYFAFWGKKKRQISKKQFENEIMVRKLGLDLDRRQGNKNGDGKAGHSWPLKCSALACHPSQVASFNERNKKHGINVEYAPNGTAIIPDNGAYKRLLKAEGAHHRNAYC